MPDAVAVIGAGSWGTTLASLACGRSRTTLWAKREELARHINTHNENPDYLPGVWLPPALRCTSSLGEAVDGASLVVMAVPSHGFRDVFRRVAPHLPANASILSVVKGLEQGSSLRMTEVVDDVVPGRCRGVLSGPNLAKEIAAGQPAATVVAMTDDVAGRFVQDLLNGPTLRVYTNPDVLGCEIAGATKNVLAIAAGMSSGLGLGDSSLAALITRGLTELGRLVMALGGDRLTVAGLAGVGDLVATCTSPMSRNRRLGEELGRGRALDDIVANMQMVAEGVKTARPLLDIAGSNGVEMPIAEQVVAVLDRRHSAADAIPALMGRSAKAEFDEADRQQGRGRQFR